MACFAFKVLSSCAARNSLMWSPFTLHCFYYMCTCSLDVLVKHRPLIFDIFALCGLVLMVWISLWVVYFSRTDTNTGTLQTNACCLFFLNDFSLCQLVSNAVLGVWCSAVFVVPFTRDYITILYSLNCQVILMPCIYLALTAYVAWMLICT